MLSPLPSGILEYPPKVWQMAGLLTTHNMVEMPWLRGAHWRNVFRGRHPLLPLLRNQGPSSNISGILLIFPF